MTTTNRNSTHPSTARRVVGAVSAAAAVAVIGVTALTPQTAAAAGIAAGHRHPLRQPASTGPAAMPTSSDAVAVTYRWTGAGWVRVRPVR